MRNFFKVFGNVLKAYNLEEKVLSLVFLLLFAFFGVKAGLYLLSPSSLLMADVDTYTEAVISSRPVLINPLYTDFSQANRDISTLVFSGLLKYDPKLKAFVDDLASLKISDDRKEYTFTLKDGVMWHDGQSLTADDVIFTYGLIQSEEFQNPLLRANFEGVKIEKIDEKTIKMSLTKPNSFFVSTLNVGILPQHILKDTSTADLLISQFNLSPVGTGPYKVNSQLETTGDGTQRVLLVRNENYYSIKPKINQIRFDFYPDENVLLKEKAAVNIVSKVTGALRDLANDQRFQKLSYSLPQYTGIFFNTESAKLKNQKVRVALVKLVDKDQLIAQLQDKIRVDTPLMELNQKDWIFKPDEKEANGALFDAGYKFKKDDKGELIAGETYRRDKDGNEYELNLAARKFEDGSEQASEAEKTVNYLVEAWKKGGVKITVNWMDEAQFAEAVNTKQYDMILAGQNMGYNLDTYPFWHSSQAKEGGLNLSKFKSFAADAQIEKIRSTFDKIEKEDRQKKLAQTLADEVPVLVLYRPNYLFLTDNKVQNVSMENWSFESDRFINVADWCIGKECNN